MEQSIFQPTMKYNLSPTPDDDGDEPIITQQVAQGKGLSLTHLVRPDLDRLEQMIGKLQRCTSTSISPPCNDTMNGQSSSVHRSHSSKCRAAPAPPPPPPAAPPVISEVYFSSSSSSSLPETFVSSLRQLFSILDKTNCGYVPFDVFKRYWTPSFSLGHPSSKLDILRELELESQSKNYLITFDLLLHVIERSLSSSKHLSSGINTSDSSLSSLSTPPILVPKVTRPAPPISFPLNRSTSVVVVAPTAKKAEPQSIPIVYRSYNTGMERNPPPTAFADSSLNPVRQRKKVVSSSSSSRMNKSSSNLFSGHSMSSRRNTIHSNEIDFAMIRAMKRFEIERDLLIQTCDTLDHVKTYLIDRLLEMKDKQHSYSLQLSTAETTGIAPESIYNRDLVADLLKLANTVMAEANYDSSKKSSHRSSSSLSSSSMNGVHQHLQQKEERIRQLETEKRVLLKELVEMRHHHRTVIPAKKS